jgi:hypothetical protein
MQQPHTKFEMCHSFFFVKLLIVTVLCVADAEPEAQRVSSSWSGSKPILIGLQITQKEAN